MYVCIDTAAVAGMSNLPADYPRDVYIDSWLCMECVSAGVFCRCSTMHKYVFILLCTRGLCTCEHMFMHTNVHTHTHTHTYIHTYIHTELSRLRFRHTVVAVHLHNLRLSHGRRLRMYMGHVHINARSHNKRKDLPKAANMHSLLAQ
jgi:hypothetical protein